MEMNIIVRYSSAGPNALPYRLTKLIIVSGGSPSQRKAVLEETKFFICRHEEYYKNQIVSNLKSLHQRGEAEAGVGRDAPGGPPPGPDGAGAGLHGGGGQLQGGVGPNLLQGGVGINLLQGGVGPDLLQGGVGPNLLEGDIQGLLRDLGQVLGRAAEDSEVGHQREEGEGDESNGHKVDDGIRAAGNLLAGQVEPRGVGREGGVSDVEHHGADNKADSEDSTPSEAADLAHDGVGLDGQDRTEITISGPKTHKPRNKAKMCLVMRCVMMTCITQLMPEAKANHQRAE